MTNNRSSKKYVRATLPNILLSIENVLLSRRQIQFMIDSIISIFRFIGRNLLHSLNQEITHRKEDIDHEEDDHFPALLVKISRWREVFFKRLEGI